MQTTGVERLFSGLIGAEYEVLSVVCPAALEVSRQVGQVVSSWNPGMSLDVFEIGCGTGNTSLSLLLAREDISITAVDNEPAMLVQAQAKLSSWLGQGRVRLLEADALSALQALPDASIDVVASGYAVHNFLEGYRRRVLGEVHRVLRPGGVFVNGDRYALDDPAAHTRLTQDEVRHWFKSFAALGRNDLLEQWIVHLFSDESPDHIMRFSPSLACLDEIGFFPVGVAFREGVNAVVVATKGAAP